MDMIGIGNGNGDGNHFTLLAAGDAHYHVDISCDSDWAVQDCASCFSLCLPLLFSGDWLLVLGFELGAPQFKCGWFPARLYCTRSRGKHYGL